VLLDGLPLIEVDQEPAVEAAPGTIFDQALRAGKHRPRHRASRDCLAVVPRDQLDSQALLGVAERQTGRLRDHGVSPD